MDSFLKKTRKIAVILVVMFLFTGAYGMTNIYKAYVNDKFIGYVNNKLEARLIYKEVINEASEKFLAVDVGKNKFTFKNANESEKLTNRDEIKKNIISEADINVEAYSMYFNDVNVGYVDNLKSGDEVVYNLKKEAINQTKLTNNHFLSVELQENVNYNKEMVKLSKVGTVKNILSNIEDINSARDKKIANVQILELKKEIEDVKQNTKILSSDNLYLGQTVKKEGEAGKKEIKRKNIYVDGKVVSTMVLEENLISRPKDDIIYTGVQNPVSKGIAFISYPSESRLITSPYGRRWGNEHHSGIDIDGRMGQSIKAVLDGRVKFAGWMNGYGYTVIIDHGSNVETLYAHASKLTAKTGEKVCKGDKIAEVGSTGRSTGPHIHFELRNNGVAVNPIGYFI